MLSVIVDDEPKNIRILKELLQSYCAGVIVTGEAANATEAYTVITKIKPQLVFLDIEMPHGNAFDLLDKLMPVDFEIIFITAFESYSLKALKYAALDYLLKPVSIDELRLAVNKAVARIQQKTLNTRLHTLLNNIQSPRPQLLKMAIPTSAGLVFYNFEDIVRFEASANYTIVILKNKDRITASKNIKEYEDMLPEDIFCRIHNSHIVNLNHIKKYHKGRGGYVVLEDGTSIEVATRRKDDFLSKFS
jgi:two-component system, LytTR family, response regulator